MNASFIFLAGLLAVSQPQPQPRYRSAMPPAPRVNSPQRVAIANTPSLRISQLYSQPLALTPALYFRAAPQGFSGWVTPSGYDPFANPYFQMATFYIVPPYRMPQVPVPFSGFSFQQVNVFGTIP